MQELTKLGQALKDDSDEVQVDWMSPTVGWVKLVNGMGVLLGGFGLSIFGMRSIGRGLEIMPFAFSGFILAAGLLAGLVSSRLKDRFVISFQDEQVYCERTLANNTHRTLLCSFEEIDRVGVECQQPTGEFQNLPQYGPVLVTKGGTVVSPRLHRAGRAEVDKVGQALAKRIGVSFDSKNLIPA